MTTLHLPDFLVLCLCADWCGTCRSYRGTFDAVAAAHPEAGFHWVDVEDDAEWFGDIEVETFPTVLILRADTVLFLGPMLPQAQHLERTVETLAALSAEEVQRYAAASAERRGWQEVADVRTALAGRARSRG